VVATFVVQTSQNLQPDFSEVTASLLTELVGIQRAVVTQENATIVPLSPLTHDNPNTPSARDVWINAIWIASLGLTLSAALISGLVKQWMHYYVADATGTPRAISCVRQYRLRGLSQWKVPWFVEFLPVIVNVAVLLFFFGLALFSLDFTDSKVITVVIGILTSIPFLFYIVSSALPLWYPQCPYKTSLTRLYNLFMKLVLKAIKQDGKYCTRFGKVLKVMKLFFRKLLARPWHLSVKDFHRTSSITHPFSDLVEFQMMTEKPGILLNSMKSRRLVQTPLNLDLSSN